ncbi:MAG TPA: DUF4190 domain-containing protein [Candidatus Saccharibacteria bacterium]|nr:DUF4190 domain-containing protein [Candidatus Saccharibacteria bacterium]HRQ98006.1 DUF4190 domain-containing protein [Candidatus Saccharibacteria bacterium]
MDNQPTTQPKQSGLATAARVLGIVSIATFVLWLLSIPLGILAIIFGAVSLKSGGKGKVGLILGIIGVVLSILSFVLIFTALPNLQKAQRDSARKFDVSQISTDITSYQAENKGLLPDPASIPVTDLSYVTSIAGSGSPTATTAVYRAGFDCDGQQASARSYAISVLLESGVTYCEEV